MNEIDLNGYRLTELTENNLINLCNLNNLEPKELKILYLRNNMLTDLDFIQENTLFINLKELWLANNDNLIDISNIKYLTNLEVLDIRNLRLDNEKETVEILKTLNKLKHLWCYHNFKIYSFKQLIEELPNIKIN